MKTRAQLVFSSIYTPIHQTMSFSLQEVDDEFHSRKEPKAKGKILKHKVNTSQVNLPLIKLWLEEEMQKHLPDDDIAVEFIYEMLESNEEPSSAEIQEQLVNFLGEEEGRAFSKQLWQLLLSGQKDKDGIPQELLEKRKQQLAREKAKSMINEMRQSDSKSSDSAYGKPRTKRAFTKDKWGGSSRRTAWNRTDTQKERGNRHGRAETPALRLRERSPDNDQKKTNYNRTKGPGVRERD